MAKEYYSIKNQVIEFNTDTNTMTVIVSNDVLTTISINRMSENIFNSQYLMFKAEVFKANASRENASDSLTDAERMGLEHLPKSSTEDAFNTLKQQALSYFQNNM